MKKWDRMKGEPPEAFDHFVAYRDKHPKERSIRKLAISLGKTSARSFERMSRNFSWADRAKAWDDEIDRRWQEKQIDELCKMHERHVNLGVGMQRAVVKELQALVFKIEKAAAGAKAKAKAAGKSKEEIAKTFHDPVLSVNEMVRLADHGISIERLSRDMPTESHEHRHADLSSLPVNKLKTLKKIMSEIEKK